MKNKKDEKIILTFTERKLIIKLIKQSLKDKNIDINKDRDEWELAQSLLMQVKDKNIERL